jgi:signal transduction histidine kinase
MSEDGVKKMADRVDVLECADLRNLVKHLRKQWEFFKKILDLIRDGIVVIGGDGEIRYCNSSAREMLAIDDGGQRNVLWKYIPEFAEFAEFDGAAAGAGGSFLTKEIRISYPRRAILNVAVTAVDGPEGNAPGKFFGDDGGAFIMRIVDVTEERSVSEKALNDGRLSSVTLLAGGIAHEIGNPLSAISLRLRLMGKQLETIAAGDVRERLETSLAICLDEISRLDGIVKNFLHAIRPQKPRLTDVFLERILAVTISLMEAEFKAQNIEVIDGVGQLPVVLGDPDQLQQVFFNILKNSCEAISGDGTIGIDGAEDDDSVALTFTDNGGGIPLDILDKIFQPYASTKKDGSGLGMAIVERILREHGATISVASAEGIGTKISLKFPRKDRRFHLLPSDPPP